jgi:hypothetical protein
MIECEGCGYLDELNRRRRKVQCVEEQVRVLFKQRENSVSDPTAQLDHHPLLLIS